MEKKGSLRKKTSISKRFLIHFIVYILPFLLLVIILHIIGVVTFSKERYLGFFSVLAGLLLGFISSKNYNEKIFGPGYELEEAYNNILDKSFLNPENNLKKGVKKNGRKK